MFKQQLAAPSARHQRFTVSVNTREGDKLPAARHGE
jgi:hypothetical protein